MPKLFIALTLCLLVGALLLGCAVVMPIPATGSTTPTSAPPKVGNSQICADGGVIAVVWEDSNGNGLQEQGEPPIPNVCIGTQKLGTTFDATAARDLCASGSNRTGEDGRWNSDLFFGSCGTPSDVAREMERQCNEYNVIVFPVSGYKVTTPETVKGCRAKFGLMRVSSP